MLQLTPNDMALLISPFFPLRVKTTITVTGAVTSVVGLAILSKMQDPSMTVGIITGLSAVLFLSSVVCWLDLGASEKVKAYETEVRKDEGNEKIEGRTIQEINKELIKVKESLLAAEKSVLERGEENKNLQDLVNKENPEIESLKKTAHEANALVNRFREEISILQMTIKDLETTIEANKEKIEKRKKITQEVKELVEGFESKISDQESQITTLNKQVTDLTQQVKELTHK